MHFAVEGAGIIELTKLDNGDLAVQHTGNHKVVRVLTSVCTEQRCRWDRTYRRWIVHAQHAHEFITELDKVTSRFYHCT